MSRFGEGGEFFGEEDQNFDYEREYADEEQEAMMGAVIPAEMMNRWKKSEIDLEFQKINFVVLRQAIQMLERSWFWRFRSLEKRIRLICDSYYAMLDLVNPSE